MISTQKGNWGKKIKERVIALLLSAVLIGSPFFVSAQVQAMDNQNSGTLQGYQSGVSAPTTVTTPTTDNQDAISAIQTQIQALMSQISSLKAKLAQLQGSGGGWCHSFDRDLKIGDNFSNGQIDVPALQQALEKDGFSISENEKGGEMGEGYFGESTASAVSGLQEKYRSGILTPLGLKYGTGYVGKATRAKLNKLYGCGVTPPPVTGKPSIGYLSPSSGTVGTQVTVYGSGFSKEWNSVNFGGGVVGRWSSDNGTSIAFSIPSEVKAGIECYTAAPCPLSPLSVRPITPGTYNVSVTNANGTSNSVQFTVIAQTTSSITVIVPNGGEVWQNGSAQTIRWSAPKDVNNVQIDLLTPSAGCQKGTPCPDMPTRVFNIAPSAPNSGVYTWIVDKDNSGNVIPDGSYLIRVLYEVPVGAEVAAQYDLSDSPFSIASGAGSNVPSIQILSPNGGETWQVGSTQNIRWTSQNLPASAYMSVQVLEKINEFDQSGNQGYLGIEMISQGQGTLNSATVTWIIPPLPSFRSLYKTTGQFVVRISGCVPDSTTIEGSRCSNYDESDAPFSIVAGTISGVDLVDQLLTLNQQEKSLASQRNYDLLSPVLVQGSSILAKLRATIIANSTAVAVVDQPITLNQQEQSFALSQNSQITLVLQQDGTILNQLKTMFGATQPSITVLSPNGGESWQIGQKYQIKWNGTAYPADTLIQISLWDTRYGFDLGIGSTVIANTTNSGSYSFLVPSSLGYVSGGSLNGNNYKIRVAVSASSLGAKWDDSDSVFSISPPPNIAVLSPNGGETWMKGSAQTISWLYPATASISAIYLAIYLDPVGSTMPSYIIASRVPGANQSYTWKVGVDAFGNDIPPGQYTVRVYDSAGNSDQSNSPFNVTAPTASDLRTINQMGNSLESTQTILDRILKLITGQ